MKKITMEQESLLIEFIEENKNIDSLIMSLKKAKIEGNHNEFLDDLINIISSNPILIEYLLL